MTPFETLREKCLKDPAVRRDYDALELPFAMLAARARAGLTEAQLARRMKTTRDMIARLESGRAKPSTRTLQRFAEATGHRLRIVFEPVEKGKKRRAKGA